MLKVAFIGFGGIAKSSHLNPYLKLEEEGKVELCAVCDIRPEAFDSVSNINIGSSTKTIGKSVKKYMDFEIMLNEIKPDLVDVCVPTYLHKDITIKALKFGCNVLCEKPMSLNYENCCEMVKTAEKFKKKLMIGQCVRFSNRYGYLKEIVENNTYGKVLSGTFRRISSSPTWGFNGWFLDYEKSGGCLTDMHIHDLDIIRDIFGEPKKISCVSQAVYSRDDIAHSTLHYDDFFMLAIGDWSQDGIPFSADFRVSFEKAIVDLCDGKITVYERNGNVFNPQLEDEDMYYNEIEYLVNSIIDNTEIVRNPPESAALSVKLANSLTKSSEQDGILIDYSI